MGSELDRFKTRQVLNQISSKSHRSGTQIGLESDRFRFRKVQYQIGGNPVMFGLV
jgi:hypothetical protein